jgi:hypothetical protein
MYPDSEVFMPVVEGKKSHRGCAPKIRRIALKHPEMTQSQIARKVGCLPANVASVLKTFLGKNSPEQLAQFQEHRADCFDAIGMRALLSITPKKLAKASAVQAATVFGIAFDKGQLARGQATGINVNILMDVVEAIKLRDSARPVQSVGKTDIG